MRNKFVEAVIPFMGYDRSIFLTGDLGFNAFEGLRDTCKNRFINAGVAEQNMVGMAAGMALSGLRPWVYSIAPFITLRCLEQIRNDVCFHDLPVYLVGNGGGYTYGMNGASHYGLDDLGVLKCLPNIQLHFPGRGAEVDYHVGTIYRQQRPAYLRLGISGYEAKDQSAIGMNFDTLTTCYQVHDMPRFTIIGIGQGIQIALSARERFPEEMRYMDIFGVTRWPLDILNNDDELHGSIIQTRRVILIDEHYRCGSIAESLLPQVRKICEGKKMRVSIMAPYYSQDQKYGDSRFMCDQVGFTPDTLIGEIKE